MIAAMMLTQLLRADDWTAQPVAITAEASEIVEYVEKHEAVVICISAMVRPPSCMLDTFSSASAASSRP